MKHWNVLAAACAFALSALAGTSVSAASCSVTDANGTPVSTYTVQADVSSGCYAWGNGNINGNPAQDPILAGANNDGNTFNLVAASAISPISFIGEIGVDGGSATGYNTNSGTVNLGTLATGWTNLVLGLKFGDNWASFLISAADNPFTFSISPKQGAGLSHVMLYGDPASPVPLPATGLLLLGGIGGLAALRKRKAA